MYARSQKFDVNSARTIREITLCIKWWFFVEFDFWFDSIFIPVDAAAKIFMSLHVSQLNFQDFFMNQPKTYVLIFVS